MCASSAHQQECLTSHLSLSKKKNEKEAKNHLQMEETVIKKETKQSQW